MGTASPTTCFSTRRATRCASEGNDHVIELNEVHHVVTETDDQGGLDMFFNPTYRGNVIRWNYWHDIGNDRPCGQAGVRLDDSISGTLVYGNIFQRCSRAQFGGVQIHGGKENIVDNNVFLDCPIAVSFSPWGESRWKSFLAGDRVVSATTRSVNIHEPPYSTRYPALARLAENPNVNMVWRSVTFRLRPTVGPRPRYPGGDGQPRRDPRSGRDECRGASPPLGPGRRRFPTRRLSPNPRRGNRAL